MNCESLTIAPEVMSPGCAHEGDLLLRQPLWHSQRVHAIHMPAFHRLDPEARREASTQSAESAASRGLCCRTQAPC